MSECVRWHSERTGGYACELCGFEGKPDDYDGVQSNVIAEPVLTEIYGQEEPDSRVILCHECKRKARRFQIGQRVKILFEISLDSRVKEGIIYDFCSWHPHPWYVRPDGWPLDEAGIALASEEIEPTEEYPDGFNNAGAGESEVWVEWDDPNTPPCWMEVGYLDDRTG